MAEFKDVFLTLRNGKGFNQEKMADELGTSKSSVAMWETGKRFPSIDVLESIADYFNVDMDYLIGRSDIRKKIHFDEDGNAHYYMNEETREVAQAIFDNKELGLLFDAAKDAQPEDLKTVQNMLLALKRKERGDVD